MLSNLRTKISQNKTKFIFYVSCVMLMIVVFIILYINYSQQIYDLVSDPVTFKLWLDSLGFESSFIFILIRAVQTVIKIIPAEPLEIASGFLFGTFGGLMYCLIGSIIGSIFIILFAKYFGKNFIDFFVDEKSLNKIQFLFNEKNIYLLIFIIYLIPSTPKDFITYCIFLLPITPVKFLIISSIARIPSILTSTIIGYNIGQQNYFQATAVFILTIALSAIGLIVYNNIRKRHTEKKNLLIKS